MAEGTPDGSPEATPDVPAARGGLRWKRVSLVFVSVIAVAFIAISVLQIIPAVFGAWVHPLPTSSPGSPARICAEGVRDLSRALARASALAGPAFDEALQPEWKNAPAIEKACASSPEGLDAWASLLRLRSAELQFGGRAGAPLAPLEREVASHLPVDLR